MKKIIAVAWIVFTATLVHAQKPIELYDLIKHFIPDSSSGKDYYSKAITASPVEWLTSKANEKTGNIKIAINGKNPSIDPEDKVTHIELNGLTEYSKIKFRCNIWNETEYEGIESLLSQQSYKYNIYVECDSSTADLSQPKIYELEIPGKNKVWLACYNERGNNYGQLYLVVYLNQNEVAKNCDDARQDFY